MATAEAVVAVLLPNHVVTMPPDPPPAAVARHRFEPVDSECGVARSGKCKARDKTAKNEDVAVAQKLRAPSASSRSCEAIHPKTGIGVTVRQQTCNLRASANDRLYGGQNSVVRLQAIPSKTLHLKVTRPLPPYDESIWPVVPKRH